MKKLAFLLLIVLGSCSDPQVALVNGSTTQLSHWDGRWLVINYWAEWCGPCRHEIPELNELHAERVANGVVVLGVNWDGFTGAKLDEQIANLDIKFPILVEDPYTMWGYERPMQLPMTALISPEREVAKILIGPQTKDSILAYIQSLSQ